MVKYKIDDEIVYTTSNCMSGGTATVYLAQYKGEDGYVVKMLHEKPTKRQIKRFQYEIEEMIKLKEIQGVLPILKYQIKGPQSWYLMPKAVPLLEHIKTETKKINISDYHKKEEKILKIKIQAILELATTLKYLHSQNIHHRDIKPQNIYFFDGKYCFGDFGLIDFPGKDDLTKTSERVGPQGYLPDEVRSNTKNIDFKKSDIYELAKTLWVLITGNKTVFSGKYDEDDREIGISYYLRKQHHLIEIDILLRKSTEKIPQLRPDISTFIAYLDLWIKSTTDMNYMVASEWDFIKNKLFPSIIPTTAKFNNINEIKKILATLCRLPGINHMFLPDGGGLDLESIEDSHENGCLNLLCNGIWLLIKPKCLIFENIENNPFWTYIYIETEKLNETEINECDDKRSNEYHEELTLLPNGVYHHGSVYQYNHFEDGTKIPENTRRIYRYHASTAFVIFSKISIYNRTPSTYDARHSYFSPEKFRILIEKMKLIFENDPDMYKKLVDTPFFIKSEKTEEYANTLQEENSYILRNKIEDVKELLGNQNLGSIIRPIKTASESELFFYITIENSSIKFDDPNSFKKLYLSNSYLLQSFSLRPPDDMLLFNNADNAKCALNAIKSFLHSQCNKNNRTPDDYDKELLFKINLIRNKDINPTHIFTREEINNILKNGDDKKNNTLVVDGRGFPFLLENTYDVSAFPVYLETFYAGNNYVGRFTDIENRDEEYLLCLGGWLDYLKTNEQQTPVLPGLRKEEELLEEIKRYYQE